jgi:hypothetical protein
MGDIRVLKPDIVLDVERYNLWYLPHFPMELPLRRPRDRALKWRQQLLESIRDEGLRHPVLVYGHSPKGAFNMTRWGYANEDRDPSMYIAFGTNRYWALEKLGWTKMPVILSLNKGVLPDPAWGAATRIRPHDFHNFAPPGRIFVQEHAFGWELRTLPEDEFGS